MIRRLTPATLTIVLLLAFWVLVLIAASQQSGYQHGRDFVSALASRGATDPWIGISAITCFALATLACAWSVWPLTRVGAVALIVGGVSSLVTAAARITCPAGAAMCSTSKAPPALRDGFDVAHGISVGVYEVSLVIAVCAVAQIVFPKQRLFAVVLLAVVVFSVVLLLTLPAASPGGQQRLWLATNSALLVALALSSAHTVRVRSIVDGDTQAVTGPLDSGLGTDVRGIL